MPLRYHVYILIAAFIWGSSFVVTKGALSFVPTSEVLMFRFGAAVPVMAIIFRKHMRQFLEPGHVCAGLVMGLVTFIAFYFQVKGLNYTTPGKNAFITDLYCIIVPFLAWAASGKRPTVFNIVAAALCVVGVGFLSLDGSAGPGLGLGEAITLVGALGYALQFSLMPRFTQGRDVFVITTWYFIGTAACALVTLLVFEQPVAPSDIPARAWAALAYLAFVVTAIALVLQNISLANLDATTCSVLASTESVFAVVISMAVGTEVITPRILTGFAIMFAGIMCSEALPLLADRRKGNKGAERNAK